MDLRTKKGKESTPGERRGAKPWEREREKASTHAHESMGSFVLRGFNRGDFRRGLRGRSQ